MSGTMFKAVVWKELRANLKWAIVALLCMTAGLIWNLPLFGGGLQDEGANIYIIINSLEATAAYCAVLAGLLIGVAQALAENRGDKWGFLAHRPVTRSTLFWDKTTAGILLYAISTGVPVAAALFRIATPGYLPVLFDWRIALPVIANLLCGLVFYFAGFLTGMRQARWYGSRALGIGAAFWCIGMQGAIATTFWHAISICAAGLIIVGTAAWSTFIAGGQYGSQPRIGRIATGLSIGLGLVLAGFIALMLSVDRFEVDAAPPGFSNLNYTVNSDGVLVRVTNDAGIAEISDLDGRPLGRYPYAALGQALSAGVLTVSVSSRLQTTPSFQSTDWLFTRLRAANMRSPLSWYYYHRLGLIAAYDILSRKHVGWMGPDGFSPGEAKPRPFSGRMKNGSLANGDIHFVVLDDAVYRVDLDKRRVEKIFQPEPGETTLDAGAPQPNAVADFEVISTTRRVILQLRDGTKLLETPQDAKALEYPVLRVFRALQAPGVPTFLWYSALATQPTRISELNSAGAVVNSWTFPPYRASMSSWPWTAMTSAATPLIGHASLEIAKQRFKAGTSFPGPYGTARWTLAILASLVSAAAVFLHGRRYAFTPDRLSTWTGIALLLGPLGYLLMLALIEWPARESCPACSRKRVVTRDRCEHCGEPFPAPPKDGTEIFEPLSAQPH